MSQYSGWWYFIFHLLLETLFITLHLLITNRADANTEQVSHTTHSSELITNFLLTNSPGSQPAACLACSVSCIKTSFIVQTDCVLEKLLTPTYLPPIYLIYLHLQSTLQTTCTDT